MRHQDDEGLEYEANRAVQLSLTGKAAIHPRQIPIINRGFSPTEQQLSDYRKDIEVMEEAYV